jgi:putative intracellular protease/amidase
MPQKRRLSGRKIAALAADGFEKVELVLPLRALQLAGAKVDVVSTPTTDYCFRAASSTPICSGSRQRRGTLSARSTTMASQSSRCVTVRGCLRRQACSLGAP